MPVIDPHPITITVNDTDGNPLENATVYVKNTTKGTQTSTSTTNGSGQVVVDLANLPLASGETLQYESTDSILIIAYSGNDSDSESYTISGSSGTATLDLVTFDTTDVLELAETLLENNWNDYHTNSLTPIVDQIVNQKTMDLANNDYVLLYQTPGTIDPFGIGALEWAHEEIVSCDIRTTYKKSDMNTIRGHLIRMKDEVIRIFKANVTNPGSPWCQVILKRENDLSDKNLGFGRCVIDVAFQRWTVFES